MKIITREIISTDWITIVILTCVILLATAKILNTVRFSEFMMLFSNNKYTVLNQKVNKLSTWFNALLTLVQVLSISLFIFLYANTAQWASEGTDLDLYLKISSLYLFILVCKILVEKIISTIFSIETLIDDYVFHKISYRNFLGVILLPLNLIFVYTTKPSKIILIILIILLLFLNLIVLFSIYKKNENIILNHKFYFILYLCALEIGPYFILYRLVV